MSKSRPVYQNLVLDPTGRAHLLVSEMPMIGLPESPHDLSIFEICPASPDILGRLAERLRIATTGQRLYVVGTEAFLWDAYNIAQNAGLGAGEIFLTHAGSHHRRVYCTHCRTLNENVTTNIVACAGCGAHLAVRDHFSRRLAAFMGVQADAEMPGQIPQVEVVYL